MYLSDAIRIRLKNLIKENNTNGNQLALIAGFNRSNINKFLRKQNKSIKIETISQALNIGLKDFFDDKVFDDVEVNDWKF